MKNPIGNLGKFAHPKGATKPHLSPKSANWSGPQRAQVGNTQPRMPAASTKGKRI